MKSLVVPAVLALGLWMAPAIARAELPLRVPDGWDGRRQDAALVMLPRGVATGRLYTVVVPDLTMKVGSVRGLLDAGKASLGEAGTFRPSGEPARGRNDAGWEYDVVIGSIEKDGKVIYAQVMGLKKGDDEGIILVVSDSVETMTTYSDAFTAMIKTLGAPAPAPALRVEGGKVDLRYRVPAGWTSKAVEGGVLLEKSMDTMYDKYAYRVVILPSEPLRDSLRDTFLASWTALVVPALQTTIVPLPFMRRLASGTAIAYDTDSGAKTKDGSRVSGGLILLARGTRYVPIFVFFAGATGKELEADLTALIESAEIPGAGDGKVTLFAEAALTGEWNTSSSSFASYVTSSGAYAGDASITTAETVILAADHSFKRSFIGVKSQLVVREGDAGKWSLDDMRLLQTGKEKRTSWVLAVGSDPKVGAFLVLSTYSNVEEKASFSNPRGAFQGTWFKRKP